MVALLDSTELHEHYASHLERYVSQYPGQVVRLSFSQQGVREQFMTKREYRQMLRENKQNLRAFLHHPVSQHVLGGFIGDVIYEEIPLTMPQPFAIIGELESLSSSS